MTREQLIQELLAQFRTVFHGVKAGVRDPHAHHDLTSGEVTVLMTLARCGRSLSVKDLAAELGMTSGGVTQLVDKLVEKQLAERSSDPADRRTVIVRPSAKATALHADVRQQFRERMTAVFGKLSTDELTQLVALLKKVAPDQTADRVRE